MKICWDMLEGVCLTRNGTFRKGESGYIYKESCINCGEPYLAQNRGYISSFCSVSCSTSGKNNPMYGIKRYGSSNPSYRGGVSKSGLAVYNTYKGRLELYEDVRKQEGTNLLEVRCTYCGRWYTPTYNSITDRLRSTNNLSLGECRLYCSENCKLACPTYGQKMYPKGFKHTTSREVSTYLRQMVLERDNWTCQICGKTSKEAQLHVHHMDPVAQNPMFQNDVDSCITLCKKSADM
jgi:hypothetical protein